MFLSKTTFCNLIESQMTKTTENSIYVDLKSKNLQSIFIKF